MWVWGQRKIRWWHRLTAPLSRQQEIISASAAARWLTSSELHLEPESGGKRSFLATFHPNLQPTQQMWCCAEAPLEDSARQKFTLYMLSIYITNKIRRSLSPVPLTIFHVVKYMLVRGDHMLLWVMSHLESIAHLGGETFHYTLAKLL